MRTAIGLAIALLGMAWAVPSFPTAALASTPADVVWIGAADALAGDTTDVGMVFEGTAGRVARVEGRIGVAPPLRILVRGDGTPECEIGPELGADASAVAFVPPSCASAGTCSSVRVVIEWSDPFATLPRLAQLLRCRIAIAAEAAIGEYPVSIFDVVASDTTGARVDVSGLGGLVRVKPLQVLIDLTDSAANPGEETTVVARLMTDGAPVVATKNRIDFSPAARIAARANGSPDCVVNPALGKDQGGFSFVPPGCRGDACTGVRAVLLSFANQDPIPNGATLYSCRVRVAADAAPGHYVLQNHEQSASDAVGALFPGRGRDATITVRSPGVVSIDIGRTRASAGQRVSIEVRLRNVAADAPATVGIQNDITFDPVVRIAARPGGSPACEVNPDIHKEASSFQFLPPGCAGASCIGVRALVLSAQNLAAIRPGAVLYRCMVDVDEDAALGVYPLRGENPAGSSASGQPVDATVRDGHLEVICTGDCDGNGRVQIFELVFGVNMLLGYEPLAACPILDADESDDVTVSEIVQGVRNALRGCRLAPAR